MSEQPASVLVVDDNPQLLGMVARLLRSHGMRVTTTSTSLGVSNLVRRLQPDVVLLDVNIPELSGDALIPVVRRSALPKTQFVLYSSRDEAELRSLAAQSHADGWLQKSADGAQVVDYVMDIVRRRKNVG
jgi:two-component system OmpR family response regulator